MRDTFNRTESAGRSAGTRKLEVLTDGSAGRGREYTFVPSDADRYERRTTWITVDERTIVDLSDNR